MDMLAVLNLIFIYLMKNILDLIGKIYLIYYYNFFRSFHFEIGKVLYNFMDNKLKNKKSHIC